MNPSAGTDSTPSSWSVAGSESGERLDRYVARRLGKARNQIQRWIADGRIELNSRSAKPSTAVVAGDRVDCRPPEEPADPGLEPEPGPLEVLYEDADLAVVVKPAGLTVHPGAGRTTGTLAHILLGRYPEIAGVGGRGRPGIVHRLDKDTSGVMVVARSESAYLRLQEAFAERRIAKAYLAIAYGVPSETEGEIALPIARHRRERQKMTVSRRGRPALSRYRVLASTAGVSLVEIDLETGRTHQIRVHLKAIGHPLIGDPVYGEKRWRGLEGRFQGVLRRFPRPALHARRLAFDHPSSGREMAFEAPVAEDLERLWRDLGGEPCWS